MFKTILVNSHSNSEKLALTLLMQLITTWHLINKQSNNLNDLPNLCLLENSLCKPCKRFFK